MAYGLNYTLTQRLRDDTLQIVKIYKKDYSGSVKTYQPTKIILQPNSNEEDPIANIISSQLDVSFIISTEDDYEKFPDLLNFDDTLYYVELVIDDIIKWKGFLFNDYINVPFTTGNQEVNFVCVDGLSLIKYNTYDTDNSINSVIPLINLIGECLSNLNYKEAANLYACCSYYAEGMLDRGDGGQYEPFAQSSIYIKDIINVDYYTILENIVKTFGCRLFQANGDWYILPMNDMASTIYYTKYSVTPAPEVISFGTLDNIINIEPYQDGNVHFVDNSQTKIVRKGYQVVESSSKYTFVENAANNGTFKKVESGIPIGWKQELTGTGIGTLVIQPELDYNYYTIKKGASSLNLSTLKNVVPPYFKEYFAPYMSGPGATLSFQFRAAEIGDKIGIRIELYQPTGRTGFTSYYLNPEYKWTTNSLSIISATAQKNEVFEDITINIPVGRAANETPFLGNYYGYIIVEFIANTTPYVGGDIQNIKISQNQTQLTSLDIKRQIGEDNVIVKSIDLPYGAYYPPFTEIGERTQTNVGALYNLFTLGLFDGALLNWYRYGFPEEEFYQLHSLIIRQYSNLLNKNIATLEGDLGNYQGENGLVYLDKTYTIEDSSTNALSYDGKKFLINRLTLDTYQNQVSSIQLIEVTDTDNDSIETLKYIGL